MIDRKFGGDVFELFSNAVNCKKITIWANVLVDFVRNFEPLQDQLAKEMPGHCKTIEYCGV